MSYISYLLLCYGCLFTFVWLIRKKIRIEWKLECLKAKIMRKLKYDIKTQGDGRNIYAESQKFVFWWDECIHCRLLKTECIWGFSCRVNLLTKNHNESMPVKSSSSLSSPGYLVLFNCFVCFDIYLFIRLLSSDRFDTS